MPSDTTPQEVDARARELAAADQVMQLYGQPCAVCGLPGKSHNFRTGQTHHVARRTPCQSAPAPRR